MTATRTSLKGTATRLRMVEATLALIQAQGYHGTGLAEILDRAGSPRGSMYFHFPGGKEELAREAIGLAGVQFAAMIHEAIEQNRSPADVVSTIVETLAAMLEEGDFNVGCPVSVVTLEVAGASEQLRAACAEAYAAWQTPIRTLLLRNGHDQAMAAALASSIVSLVEGAMIASRARRDTAPLKDAKHAITVLLAAGPLAAGRAADPEAKP